LFFFGSCKSTSLLAAVGEGSLFMPRYGDRLSKYSIYR
jgi:hypothetical protein